MSVCVCGGGGGGSGTGAIIRYRRVVRNVCRRSQILKTFDIFLRGKLATISKYLEPFLPDFPLHHFQ